ncbi:MAG TPA: hypothetical protein VGL83_11860 [Stellaceae bacterium]|jgi:hypothetical protein
MAKIRYSFLRVINNPEALQKELRRYRALLDLNSDPAVMLILERLIVEAEARLATMIVGHLDEARMPPAS